jgi:hypothetical protein
MGKPSASCACRCHPALLINYLRINNRDIIAIGASAGGVEALHKLVAKLPEDLPASLLFALETHLQRNGNLAVRTLSCKGYVSVSGLILSAWARTSVQWENNSWRR